MTALKLTPAGRTDGIPTTRSDSIGVSTSVTFASGSMLASAPPSFAVPIIGATITGASLTPTTEKIALAGVTNWPLK